MPIWLELTVLMLACYGAGLSLGWILWARGSDPAALETDDNTKDDTQ